MSNILGIKKICLYKSLPRKNSLPEISLSHFENGVLKKAEKTKTI